MKRGMGFGLALCLLCLLAAPVPAGQETTVDGVLHVRNGAEPAQGSETWRLEELWRAGGEDDDVLFGVIGQVRVDEGGRIYFLDTQLSEIKVYSPDGELVSTLSREGDGPGETRNPNNFDLMLDGRIGICQLFPAKVTVIDREGSPAGGFTIGDPTQGNIALMRGVRCRGGHLVCGVETTEQTDPQTQKRYSTLASFDLEGTQLVQYNQFSWTFDFTRFVLDDTKTMDMAVRRFDVGPDGRVFTAPERDRYAIHVYRPDGTLDRIIERDLSARKRTDEEIAELRELFEMSVRQIPIETTIEIAGTEPQINWFLNGLQVREDGTLWVLTDEGAQDRPAGIMQTYDVFDAQGHFVKRVSAACPGDSQEDMLFFAGEDRVILVTGFLDAVRAMIGGGATGEDEEEPEPMQVICYRIVGTS
jgi:hypothetical protein